MNNDYTHMSNSWALNVFKFNMEKRCFLTLGKEACILPGMCLNTFTLLSSSITLETSFDEDAPPCLPDLCITVETESNWLQTFIKTPAHLPIRVIDLGETLELSPPIAAFTTRFKCSM